MSLRRTGRIARWETTRSVGSVDRRTGVVFLGVILVLGAVTPVLMNAQVSPSTGIYRVGVAEDNPYYPVVRENAALHAVDPTGTDPGTLDLRIAGDAVSVAQTPKSRAAADELRQATVAYNDKIMDAEADQAAAFPVAVTLRYREQSAPPIASGADTTSSGAGTVGSGAPGTSGSGGTPAEGPGGSGTPATNDANSNTQATSGSGATGPTTGPSSFPSAPVDGVLGTAQTGTPSSIAPPFPLRSLLLAFVFLLPFNLIIQAYGSSVIAERINRRGEPLLVSPASRSDVIAGKTLPYLVVAVVITTVIAVAIGGGWRSVLAVAPLGLLFLAATFLAAMLARSYKELTFLTVSISVGLTTYAFIPAVFADVHPIAAISPLTIVVQDLRSSPVGWGQFAVSILPVVLAALVLFRLGAGIYREEDMFTQKPLPEKVLDALAAPMGDRWRVGLWTVLFVPFVLVIELAAVAVLYVLPGQLSIPILLAVLATVEELAKSVHVFAGFERGVFSRRLNAAVGIGAISGLGFFVGEKALVITRLVGLPQLELGRVAFGSTVLGLTPAVLLFGPLLLHTVSAAISAAGASRSRLGYALGLGVAILLHLGYNLGVVSFLA